MRPRVNTDKHMVARSLTLVNELTISPINAAVAVEDPSTSTQVRIGSVISAIYVEVWILANSQQPGTFNLTVEKISSGQSNMTQVQSTNLHSYPNKKNIFYTTQGLVGDANTNPTPVIRQWIKIPKGKQRMGLGDIIAINVSSQAEDQNHCGYVIYKEQY